MAKPKTTARHKSWRARREDEERLSRIQEQRKDLNLTETQIIQLGIRLAEKYLVSGVAA